MKEIQCFSPCWLPSCWCAPVGGQRWTEKLGGVRSRAFRNGSQAYLVRQQSYEEELETPDGLSGTIRSNSLIYCRKINLPPGFSFVKFLFCFLLRKSYRASFISIFSHSSSKDILIRRHCTIFFTVLLIAFCTNDAHHAKGHDLYKDFCRGTSLPHHGFKSQEIF